MKYLKWLVFAVIVIAFMFVMICVRHWVDPRTACEWDPIQAITGTAADCGSAK